MNILKITLVLLIINLSWNFAEAQNTQSSKIRESLNMPHVLHSMNSWYLYQIRGSNKTELTLEAVEYSELNSQNKITGIQLELFLEPGYISESAPIINKHYFAYIDESEYPELTLALNKILSNYKARKKEEKHGSLVYTTIDGITFGYRYNRENNIAYVSFPSKNGEVKFEFPDPVKIFQVLHNKLDIATKKLYLPENIEKIKKAKKTKQEKKDVIIDDI